MRNRRIAAIVLAVAVAGLTVAATTASARPQHSGAVKAHAKAQAGGVFRVEWSRRSTSRAGSTRPMNTSARRSASTRTCSSARSSATTTSPALPATCSCPISPPTSARSSNGGKTYTFTLKDGIKFGPPLNRAITSKDVLWAFMRIGTKTIAAQYGFYYDAIKGMTAFRDGKSKVIAGIKTPDLKTISFTLTKPTGDFRYRLSMPAAGPQPQEVSGCFTQPNQYGRYVISSGPYMIAGSDKLNASSCDTIKAAGGISGWDGEKVLDLVRNPAYNPATDSTKARENLPDEFTFTVNSNADDIYARVTRGDIEEEIAGETPSVLRQYNELAAAPHQRRRPHLVPDDEPHPAAVRRPARAPRGQLRGQPRGPAQVLGRLVGRRHRDAHRAGRRARQQAQGLRALRQRQGRPRPRPRPR